MNRLLLLIFFAMTTFAYAQEICNNGIDDDGDGFIDCFDNDCTANSLCDGFFIGNDANCQAIPSQFPDFTMTLDFASPNETTNHLSRMAIGDLDRDGMPEIVTMNRYTRRVFILSGQDGSVKYQLNTPFEPYWEIAIGNIDNDNCGEIFFIGVQQGIRIFAYDCQLNFLWRSAPLLADPINYGLADFDGDGRIELYAKDEIYDAHTGTRIVRTSATNATQYNRINGGPVAVDILGNDNLELIVGLSIYQVNLGTRAQDAGSLTLLQSRPEYFIRNQYNATSVADYNQDGFLDIVASGSTNNHGANTTIFFWDVQNNNLQTYRDLASDYGPNGWVNGTGRVNIADLDGDGNLNVSYVSGKYLYALDHNLQLLWRKIINEETSGYTGCTLFDFNGDGKSEIVYRDEQWIYIIDGTTGDAFNQQRCISRTNREYPIVADVDADGSTELCVTCGFDDVASWTNFNNLGYSRFAHVRVYKSASEPWVPARRLWNQHGYFVVNVNDDLTIPRKVQKHHLVFSTGSCTQGPNRPLNKFLNQAPFLDTQGCPTYSTPDLAFANTPSASTPTCPDLDFTVSFDITNLGDVSLSGNVPITFYSSNPLRTGAIKLNTITVSLSNLRPNEIFQVINATVNGNGSDSLYIVLNDAGTTVPTPISLPNTDFLECDYDNVIGIPTRSLPVTITALPESPNNTCSAPANGVARAFIPTGGNENTADYNFYWFNGATVSAPANADFTGPFYTSLPAGTYSVYAIHKTANCSSDTVQVILGETTDTFPDVTVNVLSDQTSCNPPNGALEAVIAGGTAGYSFEWEDAGAPIGVTGPLLTDRKAGTYRVVVTSPGGCSITRDGVIIDLTQEPDVTAVATPITTCIDLSSGTVSATALLAGVQQPATNYSFAWFFYDDVTSTRGSQLPAIHGTPGTPNRTGLPAGSYEVEVTEIASGCLGTTNQVVTITNETILPAVQFTELAPQTSCDPNNPNGSIAADALVNGVAQPAADFTFEWFVGQNTLPANSHPHVTGVNNRIAERLLGGGQAYTVRIRNIQTQCVAIDRTTVSENIIIPVVTLTPSPNTICDPSIAGTTFNGSVAAAINYNGNPVTDFSSYAITWFTGSTATGTPRAETTPTLSVVNSGYYTVVVRRTDTQCAALPATAEVDDATILPTIELSATPSTNCLPLLPGVIPNGSAQVTGVTNANSPANLTDFTFQWFTGAGTTSPITGAVNTQVTGLQGGASQIYSVRAINQLTGCSNTAGVIVPDARVQPIITLTATDNTICTGTPDGTASLATVTYNGVPVSSPFTGYTFNWSNGETTSSLNAVPAGIYSLTVTRTDLGCQSDPVNVEVRDNTFLPPLNVSLSNQTSCNTSTPNGAVSVSVDETAIGGGASVTTGYTFSWVNNGNPFSVPGVNAGTGVALTDLPGDVYYSVETVRTGTGCSNTVTVFLPEVLVNPVVSASSTNVTRCDTPNGSVLANVGGVQSGYTFFWLNETGSNQTSDKNIVISQADEITTDNGSYNNLIPGYYTVVARDNTTQCSSDPVTRIVINAALASSISITPGPLLPSTCGASDGQMSALVTGGTGSFDLFWHYGGPVNANINFFTNPPQFTPPDDVPFVEFFNTNNSALTDLESRLYTLIVRDRGNGCGNYQSIFLPFLDAHTVTAVAIPSTDCGLPNGQIEVTVGNFAPNTVQNFIYRLFEGENPDPAKQVGPAIGPGAAVSDPQIYAALNPGKYTVEVQQDPGTFGSSCTVFQVVEIIGVAYSPLVAITSTTANTSCDPTLPDGSISLTIDKDPNDQTTNTSFTIDITPAPAGWGGPTTIGPYPPATLPDNFSITGMQPTNYTVTISANNCTAQRNVTIPNQPLTPVLANGNIVASPSLVCTLPAGDITVVSIDRAGGNGTDPDFTNLSNYLFTWYDNGTLLPAGGIFQGQGNAPLPGQRLDAASFPSIAPGRYWVTANKNSGALGIGCTSAPFQAVIRDQSRNPEVTLLANPNTACDSQFDGQLRITVNNPGSLPTALFNYVWDVTNPAPIAAGSGNGNGVGTDGDQDNPTSLPEGTYSLTVTNPVTGCSTLTQATILQTPPAILATATKNDQLICAPDGSILVNEITVNGTIDPVPANYEFAWFANDPTSAPIQNGVGVNALTIGNYPSIGAGSYFVSVRRLTGLVPGSGCLSAPVKVDILDLSSDPLVQFTAINPNTTCDPLNPNGSLQASAAEQNATIGLYTFIWTYNAGALPGSVLENTVNPASQLTNAPEGTYSVRVVNTATSCEATRSVDLLLNQTPSLPNIVNVLPVNPVNCLPTASARVTQITIGGTTTFTAPPDDIDSGFDYTWFRGSALPADVLAGEVNSFLNGILPDRYFVQVRDLSTDCISSLVEVVIDSASIIYPEVSIRQTTPQIICDATLGGSASLIATVDLAKPLNSRNNFSNYDVFWFPNLTASGGSLNAASDTLLTSLTAGDYSVRVLDRTTQCEARQLYIIPDDSGRFKPILALTSSPLTLCNSVDGFVAATAVPFEIGTPPNNYPFSYNYQADLYFGQNPNLNNPPDVVMQNNPANPAFTEFFLEPNLSPGIYTVKLTDLNTGCLTVDTVSIKDRRVFPSPAVETIAPVTNCDPNIPNGVGRVHVNGVIAGYQFDWYEGSSASGIPFYTGVEYGQLQPVPVTYTVLATNLLTGCTGTTAASIELVPVPIPLPQIRIISHVTSCEIDNGALAASVNGNTTNYIFDWYNGTQEVPPPVNTGEFYLNLPVGTYSVTATSRITGCKSPLVSENIIEQKIFPDFEFEITPPSCDQSNGVATLIFTTQVELREIVWTDANGMVVTFGPNLTEIPAGDYRVKATTILGCSATKDITLLADIFPYNGISRNGDTKNSYFHIDCIQNFPDNLVKIFNRAGTLVYQAIGYDNNNILFDGISNKGVSPMGTNLPDGTYYYIIDKRDGSKPLAGYLEIVN
jgi:large repetitive protein